MQPPKQHSRINLAELKAQIVRKLGLEGSERYFYHLNKFLNLKISKVEFNKLCVRILGRDNIPLHNQFLHSILKNVFTATSPPPIHENDTLKSLTSVGSKEALNDGYQQNGSHSTAVQSQQGLSNGDILPLSPRKARTTSRERRAGDHRSALGANGKTKFSSQQQAAKDSSDVNVILENGLSHPPEAQGLLPQHQGLMQPVENVQEASVHHPLKSAAINDGPVSVHSKDRIELSIRDGKDVHPRSRLQAPFGVPFCPVSVGGARRGLPVASSSKCVSAFNSGVLLDSVTLKERMEQIAAAHGLEGVSMDCANLLNNGLDVYLKGLISSCIGLVAARSGHEPMRNKKALPVKLVNGVRPGHLYQMQNNGRPLDVTPEHRPHCPISLQDFRVAMELNPQQLGEDWPLLLERICTQAFEE
ncbi:OLC1v1014488C1 [Oldenlandia corymbosa var. corymbosa]|uniref:OLC1v1014488C1 n=1 Tax=Oldenlandia corymbosa var. corymbosa TaxID=529605 RepID=A0AAV1E4F1_OLDCO|nr:OLC1v1014488C1 [Oldenlandia corymbosa var. corymbosa]